MFMTHVIPPPVTQTTHNRLNDQRAKMIVSKRIFLHFVFLLCDFNQALAASAMNSDNLVIYGSPKEHKPADGSFIEYFKDHEVSSSSARENLRNMRENDFQTPAYCKSCSAEHQKYCHSENLLKDHCCCNQSHNKEQLYFIPHTCFINEERCHPSLGSCLTVMEIRNCCCDSQLKKYWKSVLSEASASRSSKYLSIILASLVAFYNY